MTRAVVLTGNNLDHLARLPEASVDAICCDPPYGMAFMGRNWDKALPDPAVWAECFRVLKPGGHMVAFGAPRLYHRLAVQIEDSAPWEIRDCLSWLYGSGFPKNHSVSRGIDKVHGAEVVRGAAFTVAGLESQASMEGTAGAKGAYQPQTPEGARWAGWGTALKPAWEPILLARRPLEGSVARNVLAHGTGAINVDACRVPTEESWGGRSGGDPLSVSAYGDGLNNQSSGSHEGGRWPANLILDEEAGAALDAEVGELKARGNKGPSSSNGKEGTAAYGDYGPAPSGPEYNYDRGGGPSRFFYCAKASRSEREAGLEDFTGGITNDGRETSIDNAYQRGATVRRNRHPTVKPIDLMRWLVRLITPPDGIVLDPFTGSGTTGAAAVLEGFPFLGMELDPDHAEIARARIAHWTPEEG